MTTHYNGRVSIKKILLVRNAYAHDFGGGERYPVNLASELTKLGFEPIIATAHQKISSLAEEKDIPNTSMPWLKFQNFSGLMIILIGFYLLWQAFLFFWYLAMIISRRVDALHLQSRDDFIAGTLAGKLLGKKVVWTDHADLKYVFLNTAHIFRNPVGKLAKLAARFADCIIVVSNNELHLIEQSLNQKTNLKFKVIYNGITDTGLRHDKDVKSPFSFIATSRLVKAKGIGELIEAANSLDNIVVKLLGEGPDEKELRQNAGNNVVFAGFPDNYLQKCAAANVFVHPSYNEGFSISLVEAAMLGMPVIATNVGGNPEIIKDKETGILIEPRSSSSLREAMLYAINNPKAMQSYGNNLRKLYEQKFQFDNIVKDQVAPLYN